jgi:antitoxin (DNA-binding transcriptional repressor) of toxin-antitoxin stability system
MKHSTTPTLRTALAVVALSLAGLGGLLVLAPGRGVVVAPCEILPARFWELRSSERGWEARLVDYRAGGTLRVESLDPAGPARLEVLLGGNPSSARGQGSLRVRAGEPVARIVPAATPAVPGVGQALAREIRTPVSGRVLLGQGALCRVEATDTLVARIHLPQDQALPQGAGERVWVRLPGRADRVPARLLPLAPRPGAQPGQWELLALLEPGQPVEPGTWGWVQLQPHRRGWLWTLWVRFREHLQPRIQLPAR